MSDSLDDALEELERAEAEIERLTAAIRKALAMHDLDWNDHAPKMLMDALEGTKE